MKTEANPYPYPEYPRALALVQRALDWALEGIQSRFVNRDDEEKEPEDVDDVVVKISFELRGRTARLEMDFGEPLEPVREAVNGILAEDGEPCRIYHIPAPGRHIGFVFIPPDVYAAATTRGILPDDSDA